MYTAQRTRANFKTNRSVKFGELWFRFFYATARSAAFALGMLDRLDDDDGANLAFYTDEVVLDAVYDVFFGCEFVHKERNIVTVH